MLIAQLIWDSDQYCHKLYASSMVGFGVDFNAPRFPFVIPTLGYRWFVKPWWLPLWSLLSWVGRTSYRSVMDDETGKATATATVRRFATNVLRQVQTAESFEPDYRMSDDEVL